MKRQSEPVSASTPSRKIKATRYEEPLILRRRLAVVPSRLPQPKARRMLKAKKAKQTPQGGNIKKRIFQHVAYPSCQVIIFALQKKLLVQLQPKNKLSNGQ